MTTDDVPVNNLIPSSQAISNGKLTEAVLVDLQDRSKVEVLEKKYLINGEKRNYLSELVLQCNTLDSEKNKYALVGRIVSKISKKHYADDPEKQLLFHACVRAGLEENKQISVGDIGTRVFSNEPEILKEYYGLTEKYHMENEVLSPKEEGIVKKLEKEHIVTDNGIEITIPSDLLQGNDHITFSSERDGSVSITIKNIERVKVRQ